MCLSLLRQLALYICIIYGTMGPADVPQDGGDDEAHVEVTGQDDHVDEAVLSPRTTEVWTTRPANARIEAGQVLLNKGGVYWASPSTAVPALRRMTMISRTCQLLLSVYS